VTEINKYPHILWEDCIEFVLLFAPNGNQQVLAGNLCAGAFLTLDEASATIHHSHFFDGGCSSPPRQYPFAQSQQ